VGEFGWVGYVEGELEQGGFGRVGFDKGSSFAVGYGFGNTIVQSVVRWRLSKGGGDDQLV